MKKLLLALLLAVMTATPAFAQSGASVRQSGNVTPGHVPMWTTNGVIQDGGTAAQGFLTSLGVTNNSGPGICINSAPITAPYNRLCLSVGTSAAASISLQNLGGATAQRLDFIVNGVTYPFPGRGSGDVLGPGASTVGHVAIWNDTLGTLLADAGNAIIDGNLKITGSNILEFNDGNTAGGLGGTIRFNTGASTFDIQSIHQGTGTLPINLNPAGGDVVVGGTLKVPANGMIIGGQSPTFGSAIDVQSSAPITGIRTSIVENAAVSVVMSDFELSMVNVSVFADSGATRAFIAARAPATAISDIRASEHQVSRFAGTPFGQTWGLEVGIHSEVDSGWTAFTATRVSAGINISSNHAGWTPTGVRNDYGVVVNGSDGWRFPFVAIDTDAATPLFYVSQNGTLYAASVAAALTSARIWVGNGSNISTAVAISGDATLANTGALTLASVISAAGPIGSATITPIITYDAKGRLTTVSSATITPSIGSITGLGTGVATFLAIPSSANLASALTDETGSGLAVFGTSPNFLGAPTFNGSAWTFNPSTGVGGVVINGPAGGPVTLDVFGASTRDSYIRLGAVSSGQFEFQVNNSGDWLANVASVANGMFRANRSGAVSNTLVLDSGNASLQSGNDASSTSTGALRVTGGASINKRVFMNGITTSAGLQTAVLCQSSAGEVIADSVACLASSGKFKDIISTLSDDEVAKLTSQFEVKEWRYKREPGSVFPDNYYKPRIGLIAEDVEKVDSRLVEYDRDGVVRTIDYNAIISLLGRRLQALEQRIR